MKWIEKGEMWGKLMKMYLMERKRFVDIDSPEDLRDAERIMRELGFA